MTSESAFERRGCVIRHDRSGNWQWDEQPFGISKRGVWDEYKRVKNPAVDRRIGTSAQVALQSSRYPNTGHVHVPFGEIVALTVYWTVCWR
jgi:hypothetical protein